MGSTTSGAISGKPKPASSLAPRSARPHTPTAIRGASDSLPRDTSRYPFHATKVFVLHAYRYSPALTWESAAFSTVIVSKLIQGFTSSPSRNHLGFGFPVTLARTIHCLADFSATCLAYVLSIIKERCVGHIWIRGFLEGLKFFPCASDNSRFLSLTSHPFQGASTSTSRPADVLSIHIFHIRGFGFRPVPSHAMSVRITGEPTDSRNEHYARLPQFRICAQPLQRVHQSCLMYSPTESGMLVVVAFSPVEVASTGGRCWLQRQLIDSAIQMDRTYPTAKSSVSTSTSTWRDVLAPGKRISQAQVGNLRLKTNVLACISVSPHLFGNLRASGAVEWLVEVITPVQQLNGQK